MRRFRALKNSGFAIISQIIIVILRFLNRRVLVMFLSQEYLGVNGLFSDILNMLSVAELGVGSAIIFAMYKPFAEQDIRRVQALVQFYKSSYLKIGCGVTLAGLALTPFLNFFIKDPGSIENLKAIYCITLLNSTITYFFSYKTTMLSVGQRNYIQNIVDVIFRVLQLLGQIVILFLTQNYILYLAVQFLCTTGSYFVLSRISQKQYPEYFRKNEQSILEEQEKKKLFKNIKALFIHRMSYFLVNGTDNIILSKFMGLAATGVFSNYNLIFNNVFQFFTIPISAITTTVGNFVACESSESARNMFWKLNFASHWLAVVCGCCLMNLSSSFIELFFGKQYVLANAVPIIMTINFYLNVMRQTVNAYKDVKGLFWQDRFKPIIESVINLLVGILLVGKVGVISVLLGTTISALVACIIEVHIIYKYGFEINEKEYYLNYLKNAVVLVLCCILTASICGLFTFNTLITWVIRGIICFGLSNILLVLLYRRKGEYTYYKKFLIEIMRKLSGWQAEK